MFIAQKPPLPSELPTDTLFKSCGTEEMFILLGLKLEIQCYREEARKYRDKYDELLMSQIAQLDPDPE